VEIDARSSKGQELVVRLREVALLVREKLVAIGFHVCVMRESLSFGLQLKYRTLDEMDSGQVVILCYFITGLRI
jgi:hypothetical protein